MAKGRIKVNSNTVQNTRPVIMENEMRNPPPVNEGSMDVDLLDMTSLSLTDVMDICETDNCTRQTNTATSDSIMPRNNSVFTSVDEGYISRSIAGTVRLPVPETQDNRLVTPMASFDVMNVYSQDQDGDTDLHIGIIQRLTSPVLMFISAAPNNEWLNIVNLRLQTPLHLAVITEQVNIVRRLMTSGARVDVSDIHGNTPLHIACREGYVDIVQCLLRPVYYEETLLNKYDIPYQRIPQDLNKRNSDGHTCLHLAAMSTHLRVLELLLSKGADINIGDGTSGRTILHYAAETGNRILLHFLLSQRKINISCRTFGGHTPLRLAAGRGYGDVVNILLSHGADVTDIDETDEDEVDDFCINGQPIAV